MTKHLKALDTNEIFDKIDCRSIFESYPYLKEIDFYQNALIKNHLGAVISINGVIQYIELSKQILAEELSNLREVIIHEFCHVIAIKEYNDFSHGEKFIKLMNQFGYYTDDYKVAHTEPTVRIIKENGRRVIKKIDKNKEFLDMFKRILAEFTEK